MLQVYHGNLQQHFTAYFLNPIWMIRRKETKAKNEGKKTGLAEEWEEKNEMKKDWGSRGAKTVATVEQVRYLVLIKSILKLWC